MKKFLSLMVAVAFALVSVSPTWAGETTMGRVKSVAADKNQFVLTGSDGKDQLYTISGTGKCWGDSKECKVADLKVGEPALVVYSTVNSGLYASTVIQPSKDKQCASMSGKISSIKGDRQFVLLFEGKETLITLTDKGTVNTPAKMNDKLSNLTTGQEVTVHYVKLPDGGLYASCVEGKK